MERHKMERHNTMKSNILKYMTSGAVALGLTLSTYATSITGGISFSGAYTPQTAPAVTQPDLNLATQIAFLTTIVGPITGTSGSFTVIPDLNSVTMFSPLVLKPSPVVPGSALWSTSYNGNTFSLTLSSMS